ncbi:MAG: peptidase M14 [Alphaproteobacteria bacterium]|nr:peptidase M14 [Alphaproteobacteria bacterium]MBM3652634.1 peptidase M14 [Alphaproteobacteria bacterium]
MRSKVTDAPCALLDRLPDGFLDCPANRLKEILPRPTLFDLPGRNPQPLFVSTLLHGNETSGLAAVQETLRRHAERGLNRSLILFIGNVDAAAENVRTLPGQRDFNRVWPGTAFPDDPLAHMARWIYDYVGSRAAFAAVDIHNNTGFNPHYSCISRLDVKYVALAQLFSRIVVLFQRPRGTCAAAFAELCPAITVECGKSELEAGAQHAVELLDACLSIAQLPCHPPAPHDVDLLRTHAIVKPPAGASFSFDGTPADFLFRPDIDHLNFSELDAGASFGALGDEAARLDVLPGDGFDTQPIDYFDYAGGEIRLARPAIPAMLTVDRRAVQQDCLCYLMHRIGVDGAGE